MFNMNHGQELQPLDLSHESMLLPPHQIVSPASSIGSNSSGPSSPHSGPFTPTAMLAHHFSHLATADPSSLQCGADSPQHIMDLEMGLQMQLQQQQEMNESQFSSYAWGDSTSLWSSDSTDLMFTGDDFDLSAIPPIELGIPKYLQEYEAQGSPPGELGFPDHQHSAQSYLPDHMLGFDEMMSGHSF